MKRKPPTKTAAKTAPPPDSYTIARFCELAGLDRHWLSITAESLRLTPIGKSAVQRADVYSIRDLVRAAVGGDIEAEKLRLTRESATKLELQNMRARGELIEVSKVKKLGEVIMIAMRNKILQFPVSESEQDGCLLELMRLREIDWEKEAMRDA